MKRLLMPLSVSFRGQLIPTRKKEQWNWKPPRLNTNYNLGQNKWNIWTTPSPNSMMPKWRVFAPSRLHHCFRGGWGIIVSLYSVQDCSLETSRETRKQTVSRSIDRSNNLSINLLLIMSGIHVKTWDESCHSYLNQRLTDKALDNT